jgi:hypothetical protein
MAGSERRAQGHAIPDLEGETMGSMRFLRLIGCGVLLVWGATAAQAQTGRAGTPAELMSALKVGQWVKIQGPTAKEAVVQCTEAKMLTGDFLDGDWQISSAVRSVDPAKGTFMVYTMRCKLAENCSFKSKKNPGFKGLAQVKPGMYVNVEGTFLRDGTLLAQKVGDKADELDDKPEHSGLVRLRGRIDKLDAATNTVTVMGIPFQVNSHTQAKSVIR